MLIVPEEPDGETVKVPVLKVFDGDGFLTRIDLPHRGTSFEATVRFGFTDAPEMQQPGGREAQEYLTRLIGGKWLELSILMKMDTGQIVDRHGRIVAVPYLRECPGQSAQRWPTFERSSPWITECRNVELEMVLNGWAWVLDRYEPEDRYAVALDEARCHRRGIWARGDNLHPGEFKKRQHRNKELVTSRQRSLFEDGQSDARCPIEECDGTLVQRSGRFGTFLGCSKFPRCRHSQASS